MQTVISYKCVNLFSADKLENTFKYVHTSLRVKINCLYISSDTETTSKQCIQQLTVLG